MLHLPFVEPLGYSYRLHVEAFPARLGVAESQCLQGQTCNKLSQLSCDLQIAFRLGWDGGESNSYVELPPSS